MMNRQGCNHVNEPPALIAAALAFTFISPNAHADILHSYKEYVTQFSRIEHISLDAEYTRAMTISPAPDIYINAVASGSYRYIYSRGNFRVDCEITPSNDESAHLAQIGSYAFNGDLFQVESPLTGAQQVFQTEPLAGTDFPMNPLIMSIAFLAEGHPAPTLLGIEHFVNCDACEEHLDKAVVKVDDNGESYVLFRPELPNNPSSIEYHVYLREFTLDPVTIRQLPYKQIMFADGIEQAIIDTMGYTNVWPENLALPASVSFTLIENEEATLEFSATIDSYTTQTPSETVFDLEVNESLAQIDDMGAIRNPEGRVATLPERPDDADTDAESKSGVFDQSWVRFIAGFGAITCVGLVIARYQLKK